MSIAPGRSIPPSGYLDNLGVAVALFFDLEIPCDERRHYMQDQCAAIDAPQVSAHGGIAFKIDFHVCQANAGELDRFGREK